MRLGFPRGRAALGFIPSETCAWPSDPARTAQIERASDAAQAGARGRVALPAQAQVAAWVRPSAAQSRGPSRFWPFWAETERGRARLNIFFFFLKN